MGFDFNGSVIYGFHIAQNLIHRNQKALIAVFISFYNLVFICSSESNNLNRNVVFIRQKTGHDIILAVIKS